MDDEQNQIKKFRSPPYPSIGLDKAIERARQLYQKALHHGVGVPVLADAWEYGEKSSGLFATAAALIQFGFLSDDGSGNKRKFTLTDPAVRIIKDADPTSAKRIEAIQTAALRPMIHKELWTRFGPATDVSPFVLRNYLRLDRGDEGKARYSDQGAEDVIRTYLDAIKFAGLHESGAGLPADEEVGEQEREPPDGSEKRALDAVLEAPKDKALPKVPGERELISGLLSRESGFRLLVHGHIGPKEIGRLIAKLELDRDILAESDGE